jgi:hypothetical protein
MFGCDRFSSVCNEYPWQWSPADVGDYVTVLHARAHEHGWAELCHRVFGEYPAQVCFEHNLPVHVSENEADPRRRAFSRDEIQLLFDCFDNRVDELYAANKKAWLTTLRSRGCLWARLRFEACRTGRARPTHRPCFYSVSPE